MLLLTSILNPTFISLRKLAITSVTKLNSLLTLKSSKFVSRFPISESMNILLSSLGVNVTSILLFNAATNAYLPRKTACSPINIMLPGALTLYCSVSIFLYNIITIFLPNYKNYSSIISNVRPCTRNFS